MKARCTALLALALGGTSAWADDPAPAPAPAPDTPARPTPSDSIPAAPPVEAPPPAHTDSPPLPPAATVPDAAATKRHSPEDDIDWSTAPPADQASGVERDEPPTPRDKVRDVARALLFIPRWIVWGVAQPMRGTAYVYDHYHINGLFSSTFYDQQQVYGIYPTASYDTDYGISVGLRGVHHDLLGKRERLKLRGDFGGRYRFGYGANLRSGTRFGSRLGLELDFGQERRPNERFYGIGNLDEVSSMPPAPIAPDAAAVSTRFREDKIGGLARVAAHLIGAFDINVTGGISKRQSQEASESDSIENSYMTDQLAGWNEDVQHVQGELELIYDTRHATNPYMSRAIDATGWYIAGHIGRTRGVGGDPSSYDFAGGEAQRFIDLWRGSRILSLRAAVETVMNDDYVSFLDLPRLGGHETLRGYPSSRFRDRSFALGSAEYSWDLGNFLAAYTFVDLGRVYHSLEDLSATDLRVGYGGGLQVHTQSSYVGRAQLAANKDGDVFFELILSPAFPRRDRIGRF